MKITFHLAPGIVPLSSPVNLTLETEASTGKALKDHIIDVYGLNPGLHIVYDGRIIGDNDIIPASSPCTLVLAKWQPSLDIELFDILHKIARQDPYLLSYLAVNPAKAREEVILYLKKTGGPLSKYFNYT
jgi:hypothetical protein